MLEYPDDSQPGVGFINVHSYVCAHNVCQLVQSQLVQVITLVFCGKIPLCPGLGERRRCQRGSTRCGRAARIDPIRANSRKGRGSLAGYAQSPRVA